MGLLIRFDHRIKNRYWIKKDENGKIVKTIITSGQVRMDTLQAKGHLRKYPSITGWYTLEQYTEIFAPILREKLKTIIEDLYGLQL